jgi:3',5'-nucleoside bisphosphate phosphatase
VIDLHTHSTASDGRCTPHELVNRAALAGVTTLSLTDHDTVAGCAAAAEVSATAGVRFVPGIEITAVMAHADVHVLGYFVDVHSPALLAFLSEQRRRRIDRVRQMIAKLADLGIRLDADAILQPGLDDAGRAVGRPWIARALVEGRFVSGTREAFDRWLARGRPAFVTRAGAAPAAVFARIHEAGGLASLAHPGVTQIDEWIREFVDSGLDAIEAYHSRHPPDVTNRYVRMARELQVLVSGGSDFHGDPSHGPVAPGCVTVRRRISIGSRRARVRADERARGWVLLALSGASRHELGHCIGIDRFLERDDLEVVAQRP